MVREGQVVEGEIEEIGQAIDDQLPLIPGVFEEWRRKQGVII